MPAASIPQLRAGGALHVGHEALEQPDGRSFRRFLRAQTWLDFDGPMARMDESMSDRLVVKVRKLSMTRAEERMWRRLGKEREALYKHMGEISQTLARLEEQNRQWLETISAMKTSKTIISRRMGEIDARLAVLRRIRSA